MKRVWVIVASAAMGIANAQAAGITGGELLGFLKSANPQDQGFARGYIDAMRDAAGGVGRNLFESADSNCQPDTADTEQTTVIVRKYIYAHPEMWQTPVNDLVPDALDATFCPGAPTSAERRKNAAEALLEFAAYRQKYGPIKVAPASR